MFQEIITRAQAIERGLTRYFTGKPCKHGHVSARQVSCWQCIECDREKKSRDYATNPRKFAERSASYRSKNTEKLRDYNARYRSENKEKIRGEKSRYYAHNSEKVIERNARYRSENQEKVREYKSRYQSENPEKTREYKARYRAKNQEIVRAEKAKRRAAKCDRIPSWYCDFDQLVMTEAADLAKRREAVTRIAWHVDHMIPLLATEASGLHCANNLQVIPGVMNMKKLNRLELTQRGEWIRAL